MVSKYVFIYDNVNAAGSDSTLTGCALYFADSELITPTTLQDITILYCCGNRRGHKASADFSDLDYNRDYELSQRPRYLPCELKDCILCKAGVSCDCGYDLWGTGGSTCCKIASYGPLSSDSDSGDEGYFSDGGVMPPLNSV